MEPFFTDPETAAAYQPAPGFGETERTVTVPGMYTGNFTGITKAAADKAFAQGSNILIKKEPPPVADKPTPVAVKKEEKPTPVPAKNPA